MRGRDSNTNPVALRFPEFSRDVYTPIARHMDVQHKHYQRKPCFVILIYPSEF
jgi:hypothetical protein